MSNIDSTRSNFFPHTKPGTNKSSQVGGAALKSNTYEKQQFIDSYTKRDAKVEIPEAIKDFSKIKKIADQTPAIDNSAKIEALKAQIKEGSYKVDYDALADKILGEEFGHESR